jgi:hypothetical protein
MNSRSYDSRKDGINAQELKTCVVMDWPQSENWENIGRFQGFSTYYGDFINTTLTLQYCHTQMARSPEVNGM